MASWVITLASQELDCRGLEFGLANGAVSPEWEITLSSASYDFVKGLVGQAVPLSIEAVTHSGAKEIPYRVEFEDVYLGELRLVSRNQYAITVRDHRSLWEGLAFSGEFNWPRITDEQRLSVEGELLGGAYLDFDRIAKYRYLPRSGCVLSGDAPPQYARAVGDDPHIVAWTAFRAVRYLLERWLPDHDADNMRASGLIVSLSRLDLDDNVHDNQYVLHRERYLGEAFSSVLDYMLDLAKLGLYVRGRVGRLYRIDYDPKIKNLGRYSGGGEIARANLSGVRAKRLIHVFPRLQELRLDGEESDTPRSRQPHELYVENVFQNPSLTRNLAGTFQAHEWLTITEGLAIYNQDQEHPWAFGRLTTADLCKFILRPEDVETFCYSADYESRIDPVCFSRLEAIMWAYRKVWRICQPWMDCIEGWEPYLAGLTDVTTRRRAFSPVYADATYIPRMTGASPESASAYVVRCWPDDASRSLENARASGYLSLRVVSKELGIFRVETILDRQALMGDVVLGVLTDLPLLDVMAAARNGRQYYRGARLEPEFHLSTIVSATIATPMHRHRRFFVITTPAGGYTEEDAEGPDQILYHTGEPLRERWVDGKTETVLDEDGLWLLETDPINAPILESVADAESSRYYFSMRDRLIGWACSPYWDDDVCRPRGSISSVVVRLSAVGDAAKVETEFRAPNPPPARDLYEMLPLNVRRYLYPRLTFNDTGAAP